MVPCTHTKLVTQAQITQGAVYEVHIRSSFLYSTHTEKVKQCSQCSFCFCRLLNAASRAVCVAFGTLLKIHL